MTCQECHDFIDAYIDNELDVAASILVKQHLRDCAQCQPLLESRKALRSVLSNPQLHFEAPESLRGRIQSALPVAPLPAIRREKMRSINPWLFVPLGLAAAFAILLGPVFINQNVMQGHSGISPLVEEVISSHVRSLLATHLLDVPSSDRHTVKPWFEGKLRFSPTVHDFTDHGFRLIGGRLDYVNDREVAALVYQRNKHVINLFTWPSESAREAAPQSFVKDGNNVLHWAHAGFEYWAVSDVNQEDLRAFADLQIKGI